MKIFIVLFSVSFSLMAKAYDFSFEYPNVFKRSETVAADYRRQFAKINESILKAHGLEVTLTSVTKHSSVHTITGKLSGVGCTIQNKLFYSLDMSQIKYPTGVELATVAGIGLIVPHTYTNPDQLDGGWDRQSILIPVCN